ncbi:MAG: glycosyltransferase family 4 protein [Microbacterium sp.]|uniref:glycosyltransferase family 4 protein n=1 Tax=Microbacterium sp. TaxID=51671 RepID=UPI0025FC769E|nr:glycosyltransferase family 1 protein [Microbacterium sp.]MBQ9916846.1 glycosyltransferase family 4 protein [Microbacterium sp.]
MKVAINGRFLLASFGGVRRCAMEITQHLSQMRSDIVLLVPPAAVDQVPEGVPYRVVGRTGGPLWEQLELPLWLRRHGSPLLLNPANIAPVLYRHQVSVQHDIAPAMRPGDFTFLFRVQWQLSVRWGMLRRGQRMVTSSAASRREIAECFGVDPATIRVIHLGADTLPIPAARPSATDSAVIVAFGRHGAGKNARATIDALALIPDDAPISLEFLGDLDPALEPYATEKGIAPGRIRWRGRVSDDELADAFGRASAFVWPSLHEGFGLPPLEAQRLGAPILASDIPINREILRDSARYFPATDAASLAALITEIAADPEARADLSRRSVANARDFTWRGTAERWNDLIEERLHEGRGGR